MSDPAVPQLLPLSQLPNRGQLPERDTPEAVLHLLRLARMRPIMDGREVTEPLLEVARRVNETLPADKRVPFDDPRADQPYEGSARAIGEYAVASIGKYVTP